LEGMVELVKRIGRAKTTEEDVFNLVIAFYEKYTVGPTIAELCQMIDIMHYKQRGTTSPGHMQVILAELYKKRLFKAEKTPGKVRRTAGRIIVIGAEWRYLGVGYHGENARKTEKSDNGTESCILGPEKRIRDG
jgi:hypothetical protein